MNNVGGTADASLAAFSQAVWRKSRRSQNDGACVEVARVGDLLGVRDSKHPDGPILMFTIQEFAAFLDGAGKGEFDDLVR